MSAVRAWPSRTNEYNRHRNRMMAYGRWQPYVDAQPAREHVLRLRAAGVGPKRIAELSGVPHGSLAKLIYGDPRRNLAPSKRIRPETEAKILAVEPTIESLLPSGLVPAHGARRRLQALAFMGYPVAWLADRVDVGNAAIWRLQHARVDQCEAATHLAVKALYRAHAMRPHDGARANLTRHAARDKGWLSPLEWDDLDSEDERAARGHMKPGPTRGGVA
jgi:hypothetical protein